MRERLVQPLRGFYGVLRDTVVEGSEHELPLYAPAMAYALVVSLAPLTLALNVFGSLFATTDLLPHVPLDPSAVSAATMIERVGGWAGPFASVAAVVLVVYGATALFSQLVHAIRRIWHQGEAVSGLKAFLHGRLLAVMLLLVTGLGLFLSAVIGNALAGLAEVFGQAENVIGTDFGWLQSGLNSRVVVDFIFATVLFTAAFDAVPLLKPRIRDVLPGSLLTAASYSAGQRVLAAYLTSSGRFDALGAFGAFVGFLVWAYYTAFIILWGAELTYQIAKRRACSRGGEDASPYQCAGPPLSPVRLPESST